MDTNGGDEAVGLSGSAGAPGALSIASEAIEYGQVPIGASKSESFTITNTGGTTLELTLSKPPIGGAFAATTSLSEGTTIAPGESLTETVKFTPTAPGPASDSWRINAKNTTGVHEVKFSGEGVGPQTPSSPSAATTVTTTGLMTGMGGISPFTASREPAPSLTHLQIRAQSAHSRPRPHELPLTYRLSEASTVKLDVYRRSVSHRCPPGIRACDRWILVKVERSGTARAGANSLTLSLAGLSLGAYRLAATPVARSGVAGTTSYLRFDIAG